MGARDGGAARRAGVDVSFACVTAGTSNNHSWQPGLPYLWQERLPTCKTDQSCYFLFQKKTTCVRLVFRAGLPGGGYLAGASRRPLLLALRLRQLGATQQRFERPAGHDLRILAAEQLERLLKGHTDAHHLE